MTETKAEVVRTLTAADIDGQGNVVIWDHGPVPPKDVAADDPRHAVAEAEAKAWHEKNGDGPVPLTMHQSDAAHAMQVEPERYSLDPIGDESELAAEVKHIQDEREASKKAAEERAAALQLAADRKAAAVTVMAARQAKALAAKSEKPATPKHAAITRHEPIKPEPHKPRSGI